MKAFEDLSYKAPYTTNKSDYYIEKGVKIERFHDGSVLIFNTMTNSNRFEAVTDDQYSTFDVFGFDAGVVHVKMDMAKNKYERGKYYDNSENTEKLWEEYTQLNELFTKFTT